MKEQEYAEKRGEEREGGQNGGRQTALDPYKTEPNTS